MCVLHLGINHSFSNPQTYAAEKQTNFIKIIRDNSLLYVVNARRIIHAFSRLLYTAV